MNSNTSIKKKAIFDLMSKKRQKQILKRFSYDEWNPFEDPKDPIDIRTDKTKRTPSALIREFLKLKYKDDQPSTSYGRGLLEMVIGLVNGDDRFLAMYEFSAWYKNLLEKEGFTLNNKL